LVDFVRDIAFCFRFLRAGEGAPHLELCLAGSRQFLASLSLSLCTTVYNNYNSSRRRITPHSHEL